MPEFLVANKDDIYCTDIAFDLGLKIIPFGREYHPDGAPAPRISVNKYEDLEGKYALTFYRRRQLPTRDDVARHFVSYPRIVASLKDSELFNVKRVDVIYPYWICGRSDHNPKTDPDENVRIRDKGRGLEYKYDAIFFKAAGADRLLTFHPHFHREPGIIEVEGIEVVCLDAVPSMVKYAKNEFGLDENWIVVNPDLKPSRKNYDIAASFASLAEVPYKFLDMYREDENTKQAKNCLDAEGKRVLIVDDIGSTFGTLETTLNSIKNSSGIYAMVVHCVLPKIGWDRARNLLDSGKLKQFVATMTIDSDFSRIPIHSAIADYYNKLKKDGTSA